MPREQLLEKVKGADAIFSLLTDKINAEVLDAAGPQLKIVANYAMGYDNLDVAAAKQRNIIMTNTPDVLTESVAEHAIALMFAIAAGLLNQTNLCATENMPAGRRCCFWEMIWWAKTLGLVGLGRIGRPWPKECTTDLR